MRFPFPVRRVAPLLLLTAAVSLAACNAGASAAGGGSTPRASDVVGTTPAPDDPVSGEPGAGGQDGDGATRVRPQRGIKDARPHAWDHIDVAADGKTLTVYYYGGVEDCYGLAEVRVATSDGLSITVLEGTRPGAGDRACIEIAVPKAATVTLDEPLVLNPAAQG